MGKRWARWRAALWRDGWLRALSLAVSVVLWLWVQGAQAVTARVRVDLDLMLPDSLVAAGAVQTTATVVVEGSLAAIRRAQIARPRLRLDLRDEPPGTHQVALAEGQWADLPGGLEVVTWSPEAIRLDLERRVTRSIEVQAATTGTPGDGASLSEVVVTPRTVEVSGARSLVRDLEVAKTRPIDVTGLNRNLDVPVELDLPSGVEVVGVWDGRARVEVSGAQATARFDGVPVLVRDPAWTLADPAATVSLTLEGPPSVLAELTPSRWVAVVDVPAGTDASRLDARFRAPRAPRWDVVLPQEDVLRVVEAPNTLSLVRR